MLGRSSPLVCPLASLGRASPSLDAQGYHHPLSSSPLDPQAYQMPRDLGHLDREDTPSPPPMDHYQQYGRSRATPVIDSYRLQDRHYQRPQRRDQNYEMSPAMERHFLINKKAPSSVGSSKTYHLSRSSSSSLDQPFISTNPNFVEYYVPRGINKVLEEQFVRKSPSAFVEKSYQSRTDRDHFKKPIKEVLHHLAPSAYAYRKDTDSTYPIDLRSPSLDSVYQERYGAGQTYAYQSVPSRTAPPIRRTSSPDLDVTTHLVDNFNKLNRASPSLDQGYHTLVSPSPGPSTPGPWTDLNVTPNVYKGKRILSKNNPFDRLPDDTALKIFSWLDSSDFCVLSRVCKRFEYLSWHPSLWRTITLKGDNLNADKAIRCVFRKLCLQGGAPAGASVERVFIKDGCRLTERGLALIARRCPELTHLQLQGCATVGSQAINDLTARCTNLQHLDLTGCTRFSWCISHPAADNATTRRLPLQYLDLTDCAALTDAGLRAAVRSCPQLVYLYLRRCIHLTDAGLKYVPAYCSGLRELSVSDCAGITDFGLYELAKLGAALRYLSVAKCTQVTDAGLKAIARRCYKLRYLNARGCEAVSDDSVTVLARSCPRLRALDIGKCDVSDAGLTALAESCPNLKKLSLRSCDMITDRGVQCIAYYCRGLQQLNIQDCQITIEGYRAVKKYCKRCVIEHTNPGFF